MSCRRVLLAARTFLLRNRNRLRAIDVADILRTLRRGDILRSGFLAGFDGPLDYTIALRRGESAHADRVPRCAPCLRESKAQLGSADAKYLSLFRCVRNLALHRRALRDDRDVVQF